MNALRYFFFVKKERGASLVLGLAFSVFLAKRSQKNGAKEERLLTLFSPRNDLETFDDGTLSIHTHTHTNIIIMVFTTVLSTVRVVASSVSRHSLSFFSLSLSARANASRPCEQIIYSAFLSTSNKNVLSTHRRNNNNHNSEPKLSLARPHRRRALSP